MSNGRQNQFFFLFCKVQICQNFPCDFYSCNIMGNVVLILLCTSYIMKKCCCIDKLFGQLQMFLQCINVHQPCNIQKMFRGMTAEDPFTFKFLYFFIMFLINRVPPDPIDTIHI